MTGNEEHNNESMRINVASMICDQNKEFNFNFFLNSASSYVLLKCTHVFKRRVK